MITRFFQACLILLFTAATAHAASTSVEGSVGFGENSSMAYGVQVRQSYEPFFSGELGSLTPFAELGVSLWTGNGDVSWGASLAPGLMFTLGTSASFEPYLGASVGGAVITEDRFNSMDLGSHALFKSKGTIGVRFGDALRHKIQGEYTNYSTWGLTTPNDGFTTYGLLYGYSF